MHSPDLAEPPTLPPPTALAEQGKLHAIEGNHSLALIYYRASMQQVSGNTNEHRILSRYFAECALESFEHMQDFESVLSYCEQAVSHYDANPPEGIVAWKDLASIYQRQTVIYLKIEQHDHAEGSANLASDIAKAHSLKLPIIDSINNWLRTRLHIDNRRLEELLKQKNYYSVTRATVDPSKATALPASVLQTFQPGRKI